MAPLIFVTGIGTDIGKTLVSAILCRAWQADYWKPVQAGTEGGTDAQRLAALTGGKIHREYKVLRKPASPHIAAREEGLRLSVADIVHAMPKTDRPLVIEGAGGLLVPINEKETMADLAEALHAQLVLVSRNYLGSINHSLLTAAYCRQKELDVLGWVFNDQYENYEQEIAGWTGYPVIGSVPFAPVADAAFVTAQAAGITPLS